jgi:molecular chaperone DnaK
VTHAVITHPITFTEGQKEGLSRAAKIAGIEVVATLHEPMAAAIAYGFGQAKRELVAVYDFGGGTFDFTVIDIVGNQLRVLISEGDDWLGGDDFDRKLADALANTFWRKTKIELRNRVVEYNRLVVACEQTKRTLSHQHVAQLKLPDIADAQGLIDLEQRIERAAFERVCRPLFESSLQIVEQALGAIGLNPDNISRVILSGGISHVPFVRQGLESFFNKSIEPVVDANHAIALGAGLYAARLARHPVKHVQSLLPV